MNPLSRGGSNWPSNLQLLCKTCNSSKNNRTMEEWLAYKERTRQHQRRKEQI
jgi:5-methylcytosine-specific restriction endonuclease McrA